MTEHKETYNGASLTARRGTVRDRINLGVLANRMDIDDDDDFGASASYTYARFLTYITIEGDLGFPVPEASAAPAELQDGLNHFLDADAALYDLIVEMLNATDEGTGDPDLQPDAAKKKD